MNTIEFTRESFEQFVEEHEGIKDLNRLTPIQLVCYLGEYLTQVNKEE